MKNIVTLLLCITLTLSFSLAQSSFSSFNTQEVVSQVRVFPNPSTNGNFSVKFEVADHSAVQVKVFNLIGREVYRESLPANPGTYQTSFNISNFPKGVYMLEITNGKQRITRRLSFR